MMWMLSNNVFQMLEEGLKRPVCRFVCTMSPDRGSARPQHTKFCT